MKSGLIQGPVSNKSIMECSPIEKIAKMIDFHFPYLVKNLLDIVEHQETDILNEKYDLNIADAYQLYVNFFLQYPLITGKEMDENLNFSRILAEYKNMELSGNVAHITEEDSCYFVSSDDVPEEIAEIDEIIAKYRAESKMYQADRISEEKGKVTVELTDGTIKEGISWGVSGVYTGQGYEIKEMLTLADLDEQGYIHLEESDIKNIL